MSGAMTSFRARDRLAALLRGERIPWTAFATSSAEEFLGVCHAQGVIGLVHQRIRALPAGCAWPLDVREALEHAVRARAVHELVQRAELCAVLDALEADGLAPILMKGTALAYSVYDEPASRPRVDTDLLIRRDDVDRFRRVMAGLGYVQPLHCGGDLVFCQFPLSKTTKAGMVHRFDCHWKISTQSMFADVLSFDEVAGRATAVPALGPHARTLASLDALLLACIHPVMHHRHAGLLVWTYDVHLLASSLSDGDFERFAATAIEKRVSTICAHQLRIAEAAFGTHVSDVAMRAMTAMRRPEPTAVYLEPDRRWLDELLSSVRGLPRWRDRLRLLREVVFPDPAYMLKAYGIASSSAAIAMLPLLYIHRLLFGAWKAVVGHK